MQVNQLLYMLWQDNLMDIVAIIWFFICFFGYKRYAIQTSRRKPCLASVLHNYRMQWMQRMLRRDIRITDVTAIANIEHQVSFFASASMIILVGLVTLFGYGGEALLMLDEIPLVINHTMSEWYAKILLLILLFVYAFFKFTWSLRQLGFVSVMISAIPQPDEHEYDCTASQNMANRTAKMISMAANNFNFGLRSFYYSLAVLTWLVNPVLFIVTTAIVVAILYSREFCSSSLAELMGLNDTKNTRTLVKYDRL